MNGNNNAAETFSSPTETLRVRIWGRARPAGSKRAFRSHVTADNPYVEAWMQEVRKAAAEAMGTRPLLSGPIRLSGSFFFSRPKCHFGTGRNAQRLRPSAPSEMVDVPDLTKLIRAIEDAMTKIVWNDDKQVCEHGCFRKQYSEDGREWADIIVESVVTAIAPAKSQQLAGQPLLNLLG